MAGGNEKRHRLQADILGISLRVSTRVQYLSLLNGQYKLILSCFFF